MIYVALAVLMLPIAAAPDHWASVLLFYASFALPVLFLQLRRRPTLLVAIWATIAARHAVAIGNAFYHDIFRAPDAMMFHRTASAFALAGGARFEPGAEFYRAMLSLVYSAASPSLLLGNETSVLAYSLSCIVYVRLMDLLKLDRLQPATLLVFGLLPAGLVYGSFTMRESWQVLFFISAVYFFLRFRLMADPFSFLLGAASALSMGFLHNGLLVYSLILAPLTLFSRIGTRATFSVGRLLGLAVALTGLIVLASAVALNKLPRSASLEALTRGDALEYAAQYREQSTQGARAEYGISLETGSPITFAKSIILLFVYYMLAPFPWQISTGLDVIGAADSWFRALLILFAVRAWRKAPPGADKDARLLLLEVYFSMSLLWAMGTINYGTGLRHHVVTNWIPAMLGLTPLWQTLTRRSRSGAGLAHQGHR